MSGKDWSLRAILLVIVVLLGMIALHPYIEPGVKVMADSARYDHVYLVSPLFVYRGQQGLLVMDRRNGNVWFIPKANDSFGNPMFIVRVPFEKLDQSPQ
jgi:hypothetical protein